MPRTTSITIGEHLDRFINEMIESGRYGSTSEVVRSALRLLEEQELRIMHCATRWRMGYTVAQAT